MREGSDAVVFACGAMVGRSLEAAAALEARGLSVKVVNVSTLKPLDRGAIIAEARGMKAVVTAEEHTVIGGLGSAIAEALRSEARAPIEFIGVQDRFGISARDYDEILEHFGLTSAAIARAVEGLVARARS